jgi:hypothetical protein
VTSVIVWINCIFIDFNKKFDLCFVFVPSHFSYCGVNLGDCFCLLLHFRSSFSVACSRPEVSILVCVKAVRTGDFQGSSSLPRSALSRSARAGRSAHFTVSFIFLPADGVFGPSPTAPSLGVFGLCQVSVSPASFFYFLFHVSWCLEHNLSQF